LLQKQQEGATGILPEKLIFPMSQANRRTKIGRRIFFRALTNWQNNIGMAIRWHLLFLVCSGKMPTLLWKHT
jgi:hypothetical protein